MATRPIRGGENKISQEYGVKSSSYRRGYHTGVDYAVPSGTPVLAPASGTATTGDGRASSDGRGFYVIIMGDDGVSHHLYHLQALGVSGRVSEGQVVGYSGNTGTATGPHLHWETRRAPHDGNSDFPPAEWLFKKQPPKASIDTIAQQVIEGKWGTGEDRKKRLTDAGYDYNAVQSAVNKKLAGTPSQPSKKYVHLPQVSSYRVYRPGGPYTVGNEIGSLNPQKYAAARKYEFKGWAMKDVALIDTHDFGRVAIYVGPGTNSRVE